MEKLSWQFLTRLSDFYKILNIKYIFSVLMLFMVLSCSKDDDEPKISTTVSSISHVKAKIGDTITITGSNLDELRTIIFKHNRKEFLNYSTKVDAYNFLSRSNEKITVEVPELVHEDITVVVPGVDDYPLELVGFIPLVNNFNKITHIQTLDEETAYILADQKVYKSDDGFYTWEMVFEPSDKQYLSTFYYLDENYSWFGISDEHPYGSSIYFSANGGADASLKFVVDTVNYGTSIRRLQFLSLNKGYFVNDDYEMFVVENDSYENIFTYYSNLSHPFGKFDIWGFKAISEDLIFFNPNTIPVLMKISNDDISYSEFQPYPDSPVFIDDVGHIAVNGDIHKSTDFGDTWTLIKEFPNHTVHIEFLNSQEGLAFVNYSPYEVHLTTDGGSTWRKTFTLPKNHNAYRTAFTASNGLMGSANGRLWKYRPE